MFNGAKNRSKSCGVSCGFSPLSLIYSLTCLEKSIGASCILLHPQAVSVFSSAFEFTCACVLHLPRFPTWIFCFSLCRFSGFGFVLPFCRSLFLGRFLSCYQSPAVHTSSSSAFKVPPEHIKLT